MIPDMLHEFINSLFLLYHKTFIDSPIIPVEIIFTDDLNKTHVELRPEEAVMLLQDNKQNDFNGRMVIPASINDTIHILLNTNRVNEYTQNGSMTWIGTFAHEFTHAIDFYQMARLEGLELYLPLESASSYMMFHQWTEYHARKCGYTFLRKYFEVTGQLLQGNDQRQYILNTEAPRQTQLFEQDYREGFPNKRLYFVMQYLGRFSVWMDLFPQEFDELKLLHFCPDAYWMKDLLVFLRKHETLDKIYGHFDELKDVLTENWTFEE